ncbi:hypothetical protein DPMN_047210 [Dreissena polymorpha]|uniref:Uncharacterized protein n=1 Tax=Dreissena polymorpha TaxID=45954 RepID=A0A9D4D9A1_DREPO|nr:hypothetical protein DPMN_047210 [Dreissena polymorpha]
MSQQRNGSPANRNAEVNPERGGVESERLLAKGKESEASLADRDSHNKNGVRIEQVALLHQAFRYRKCPTERPLRVLRAELRLLHVR